jgi:hypothetical protein
MANRNQVLNRKIQVHESLIERLEMVFPDRLPRVTGVNENITQKVYFLMGQQMVIDFIKSLQEQEQQES